MKFSTIGIFNDWDLFIEWDFHLLIIFIYWDFQRLEFSTIGIFNDCDWIYSIMLNLV